MNGKKNWRAGEKGREKEIRAFTYKVLSIGSFTWYFAFLRERESYLVKMGNVRIRQDVSLYALAWCQLFSLRLTATDGEESVSKKIYKSFLWHLQYSSHYIKLVGNIQTCIRFLFSIFIYLSVEIFNLPLSLCSSLFH